MAEIEIPSYFLCPISLQIMRDPVTLPTGITYDRSSIERWIYNGKHKVCPVTNQPLSLQIDLVPNHTLRRLIQAWCMVNASYGIERFPTPRPPVDQSYIVKIIEKAKSEELQLSCLQNLKSLVLESERNRDCIVNKSGAVDLLDLLASIVTSNCASSHIHDEALSILNLLQISEQGLIDLVAKHGDLVDSLTRSLRLSSNESRANAMILLKSIIAVIAPVRLIAISEDLFIQIVNIMKDKISMHATKLALEILIGLCPWGKNRIKVVVSGAVHTLIELLIEEQERRVNEMALVLLDKLCACAEGRAEIVSHAAGIATISKKMTRVSYLGTERAVKVLYSVSRYSGTTAVLQEMVQVGAVSKLCMLLLVDSGSKAKERAREILRMHSRVWRASPCYSPLLQVMYPC